MCGVPTLPEAVRLLPPTALAWRVAAGLLMALAFPEVGLCVGSRTEAGATVWTYAWSDWLPWVAFGAALAGCGVLLATGCWKPRGKPRPLGWLMVFMGAIFALGVGFSMPYARVTLGPERLVIEGGLFGVGASDAVDLRGLASIDVYRKRVGSRRKRRMATYADFAWRDGAKRTIGMGGDLKGAALQQVLERARKEGVRVDDRRATAP